MSQAVVAKVDGMGPNVWPTELNPGFQSDIEM